MRNLFKNAREMSKLQEYVLDEYIDCNPVSIFGDVEVTEKDNTIDANTYSAEMLESAGIFSVVLECVETKLAKMISSKLKIPTIGIGSSNNCDGQVLVIDDLIGLNNSNFRFVKKYANINRVIKKAVKRYKFDVSKKLFPKVKHSFNN